jgi:hypothetical protein
LGKKKINWNTTEQKTFEIEKKLQIQEEENIREVENRTLIEL